MILLNDLIKSLSSEKPEFFRTMVTGYEKFLGAENGLLFSADGAGNPFLVYSSGTSDENKKHIGHFLKDYILLYDWATGQDKNNQPFTFRTADSSFILTFRCSFKGILILPSFSAVNVDSSEIAAYTDTVVSLLDLLYEKKNSDGLIEKYRKKSQRIGTYLTRLTNELRTPLNAIAGFAQLLKEPDNKVENTTKYINIISDASEIIISKISSYSEIAQIEAEKKMVYKSFIPVSDFLDEVFGAYNNKFSQKGLSLEKEYLIDGKIIGIIGDAEKIRSIFDILLSNAFNNTFSGKVTIRSRINDGYVEFCVSDTGIGFSKETGMTIFNYNEVQSSMVVNSKGSGVGLIIARAYTEMMGGKIWCESLEGKGSEFYFTIPYLPVYAGSESLKAPSVISSKKIEAVKKKVLVAEDDNLNFQLIRNFLSRLDIEVIRAENGEEAVNIFKSDNIDLILMDIRMPVMDGYTATRLIREINKDVKIIAQTAFSNDKAIAVSNGCDDFISKPFNRNQLISMVTAYI